MLPLTEIPARVLDLLWKTDTSKYGWWIRGIFRFLRIAFVVIRDLADGQLTLRAMSLVYTTLLSLVPLLAVSFSVLKGFGVHNQIEPMLLNLLAPLGDKGTEITVKIIEFVDNVKVGVLGSVGLAFLLYTVIALIQKIEKSFNYTWRVSQSRPFAQRFSDYLSVIFVGPILVFSALGFSASIVNTELYHALQGVFLLGDLIQYAGKLVPYFLIISAFTFIYIFIPNARVKFISALVGAIIAGFLWESIGWFFTSFILTTTKYTAIYSAFATLIFFLIWLYLGWLILLIGASIAFYHQNPAYVALKGVSLQLSNLEKEQICMQIMLEVCQDYYASKEHMTFDDMGKKIRIPMMLLTDLLQKLEKGGYLVRTCTNPQQYYPKLPPEKILVRDFLDYVRKEGDEGSMELQRFHHNHVVSGLFEQISHATHETLAEQSFKDLVNKT